MFLIDTPSAVDGRFVSGTPQVGQAATQLSPDWLNGLQDEISAVITASGMALDKAASTQLRDAINTKIAALISARTATTGAQGIVELATSAETITGTDAGRAVTPSGLKAALLSLLLTMDGSGSGLDADLLDGYHAAAFALLALTNVVLPITTNANGTCIKLGNLWIQVGIKYSVATDTVVPVTFPVEFPNTPFWYDTGIHRTSYVYTADAASEVIGAPTTNGMNVVNNNIANNPVIDIPWIALGLA